MPYPYEYQTVVEALSSRSANALKSAARLIDERPGSLRKDQVVRLIASLARDAMPVQLLVDAVSAECAAHSPGPDERSSPWIDYFARFRSTVARAATAWKHPAVAAANDRKRQLCDLLRSLPGPRFGGNPDSRSLARELHAAGLAEPVLNSHELTTTLLDWFGGWWDGNTPDDNERMVMSALKA